mgnify:CR=1 FL=1
MGIVNFMIIIIGNIPSLIFVYYTIDLKSFGRVKSIKMAFFGKFITYFLICLYD